MRELDEKALEASNSDELLSALLTEYDPFILRCASKTAKRFVTKSDDEYSIALEAFCTAVHTYSYEKGSFINFSEIVISRRLIDYFRKQNQSAVEFSVDPSIFSGQSEENEEDAQLAAEIAVKTAVSPDNSLRDEIEAVGEHLKLYGFTFFDLVSCSPKSRKTRLCCSQAVSFMQLSPALVEEMRDKKNLPLKIIEQSTKVPRKILERHRKYIIAAIEIITGDYPNLADYLKSVGEERGT